MNTLFDLSGKVAVVTGSGRGLGKVMATGLAEFGAKVVVCDRVLDEASSYVTGAVLFVDGGYTAA